MFEVRKVVVERKSTVRSILKSINALDDIERGGCIILVGGRSIINLDKEIEAGSLLTIIPIYLLGGG